MIAKFQAKIFKSVLRLIVKWVCAPSIGDNPDNSFLVRKVGMQIYEIEIRSNCFIKKWF